MLFATEVKEFTCICCPLGCHLEVSIDEKGEVIDVAGYTCERGKAYGRQEATEPLRMVTAVICAAGCLEPLSVKTATPVPKARMDDVLACIRALDVSAPVTAGDILIADVAATGVPVIATKTLLREC